MLWMTLIVDASDNENLVRGTRNLRSSKWLAPEGLNVYDVLKYETLVLTRGSLDATGMRYQRCVQGRPYMNSVTTIVASIRRSQ